MTTPATLPPLAPALTPGAAPTPAGSAAPPAPTMASLGLGARPLLLLLDGSWALFRAFYAMPPMLAADQRPTGAIFGLLRQLEELHRRLQPAAVAVAFDETAEGFRAEIDASYKAQRGATPPELAEQWPRAIALLEALGQRTLQHPRFEADDLIATLARRGREAGYDVVIASADKDLGQLVVDGEPRVVQYEPAKERWIDEAAIVARWGVLPTALPHVQAFVGDPVDNVRGVAGIGAKTAARLIAEHGSVEGVYAALERVRPDKVQAALRAGEADARLCLRLCQLVADAPIVDGEGVALDLADLVPRAVARADAIAQAGELGFTGLLTWLREVSADRWPPPRRRRSPSRRSPTAPTTEPSPENA